MSQSRRRHYWLTCFALATLGLPLTAWGQVSALVVNPAEVKLEGNFARVQLVVTAADAAGAIQERSEDLTAGATYASSDDNIVTVNSQGLVLAPDGE